MEKKTSAYYQRQFRERLRAQGLVKKEVWILPDYATTLTKVEELLRNDNLASDLASYLGGESQNGKPSSKRHWSTERLYQVITEPAIVALLACEVELIAGIEPIIHLQMWEFGDLPVFVSVQGEQIIAETILCVVDEINDVAGFNDMVLRTHKYLPLSTISLDSLSLNDSGDGTDSFDAYQMFGAVSSQSSLSDIIIEIQMLCQNVMQSLEIYQSFFIQTATDNA